MRRPDTKERLRQQFLELRREMSFEEVYALSAEVQRRFLSTSYYSSASRIAVYASFSNEVITEEILDKAVSEGREVFFPRVTTRPLAGQCGAEGGEPHLEFYRVDHAGDLSPGSFEILEPCAKGLPVLPLEFGVIVVPGVVFDRTGGRLGYGKGYYDRALAGVTCPVVALAFERQIYEGRLPVEAHDVRMSAVVTENAVYEM